MKKMITALCLGALLTAGTVEAAVEDYTFNPGAQLQIYVMGHGDISSPTDNSDSSYVVRPDGKLDFPLVGTVQAVGKTVDEFKDELAGRLSEYIIDPKITINVTNWGSVRVYVLGNISRQGIVSLSRSHRVMDALAAARGFTPKTAKKRIILIRNGQKDNIQELNFNDFLRKGDVSQNVELHEGDCLYLTSNHKITLASILSLTSRVIGTWNDIDDVSDDDK